MVDAHGHTTSLHVSGDFLKSPMSGGLNTVWKDRGRRDVGHVGTVERFAAVNQKAKSIFATAMPQNTAGFDPAKAWNFGEISQNMIKIKCNA